MLSIFREKLDFKWSLFLLSAVFLSAQATFALAAVPAEIALVQYDADRHFGDYEINRKNLTRFAETAVAHGSKMIVFPEGSLVGYASTDRKEKWCKEISDGCRDVHTVAENIPLGPSTDYWEAFARRNNVYLLFNLPENAGGEIFYNTTVAVGPQGYISKYRKRVLYLTDTFYASAGTEEGVLDTPFGKFGLLICLDVTPVGALEAYSDHVNAAIVTMDWDDDPTGRFAARTFIRDRASAAKLPILVSDMSPWDGTGYYPVNQDRIRNGLGFTAMGIDGVSYAQVQF